MQAASNREPDGGVTWFSPALAAGHFVPWWGLITAAVAFVALVGGCTLAAALQPSSFNWLASTLSTLTEPGGAGRAAYPGRGRRRRRGGRRESRACRRLTGTRAVGRRRLHGPDRLAYRSMAAGDFGAVGTAASSLGRRRRGPARPAGLVPRRADHQRRDDWPGRAGHV